MALVVMGVSGCGKSTIGKLLATDLAATFIDGDDIHSEGNRAKMAGGIPLDDMDYDWFLQRVFRPAAARLGLKKITIHTLRHTCA